MKHSMLKFALALMLGAAAASASQAATITFNGTAPDGSFEPAGSTYSETGSGFTMSTTGSLLFVDNDALPLGGGSDVFDDDFLNFEVIGAVATFTRDGLLPFNVTSMRVGGLAAPATAELVITGFFFGGGGSISQSIMATVGSFDLVTLLGFSNLVSLEIEQMGVVQAFPAIDDLTLQPVPLPASVALLLTGLGGLGLRQRRQRAPA